MGVLRGKRSEDENDGDARGEQKESQDAHAIHDLLVLEVERLVTLMEHVDDEVAASEVNEGAAGQTLHHDETNVGLTCLRDAHTYADADWCRYDEQNERREGRA